VAGLAARQFGVVSIGQLLSLGLTYDEIRGLVAQGFLHRLFRGVFAVGHRNVGQWGWLMAASLATSDDSFLTHRTSAATRGLRAINTHAIDVTVVSGKTRSRDRLVIHRTSKPPHPEDITTSNGIRISSLPRMFIELAATETPQELERLITASARKQLLNVDAVERALERHAGRPGVGILKAAFRRYRPGPDRKSGLERTFDGALDRNPDIPKAQKNVIVDGWELDNYWPEFGLDVELDGRPYHIAVRDIEKDRLRDTKLFVRHGIVTLRFTDFRIEYSLAGCLDDIRAAIARSRRGRAASAL
jgi:very-short-patch-repair endonuclease